MEQHSGRVLYEETHKKRRIASITKIMTAILAIESGKMDETVDVSDQAVNIEGVFDLFKAGEKINIGRSCVYRFRCFVQEMMQL